jgi:hypothetical protein
MVPNGKEPVIRAAGTSLRMRFKRRIFTSLKINDISTTLVVLLATVAREVSVETPLALRPRRPNRLITD